ncbi:hypothetical protein [Chryseobacterium sp.]|uniref:hypothetical protein n=1 Tax=Chryseobacterium sp. TaxID=1871047 RepID=UPI0025C2BEC0|nr:hypothetical protein [Chryseobacterium sp.]MBV8325498.1 hypothetical protein [Chryseobacterium sp.]
MLSAILGLPIKKVHYRLKRNRATNLYIFKQLLNLFEIEEEFAVIEPVRDLVHQIKVIYPKEKRDALYNALIHEYGNPTHYYYLNEYTGKKADGKQIKTITLHSYKDTEIDHMKNNVWRFEKYAVNLQDLVTMGSPEEEYTYLTYTKIIKSH